MRIRRFVSLSLLFSILGMLTSSIVLYIVPQGRVAYWSNWSLWGLSKTQWGNLHTNMGLIMVIAAIFHVYYNWGPIMVYLKTKTREFRLFTPEFNAALVLFILVTVGTLGTWPPLSWIQSGGEKIKDHGARTLGEPPYGHAEESSMRVFLRNVGLAGEVAQANLQAAGIEITDPEMTIKDLAAQAGMSPRDLFELMKGPAGDGSGPTRSFPSHMPMGSGRKTLADFCAEYGHDVEAAVVVLEEAGWNVESGTTLRDIAAANDKEPLDLVDVLRAKLK